MREELFKKQFASPATGERKLPPRLVLFCELCVLVRVQPFSFSANFSGKRRDRMFGSSVNPASFIRFPDSHVVVHQETDS